MKSKTGTAGSTPQLDSFSWFQQPEISYIHLLWDLLPNDWRLASFQKPPKDAYDPDEYLQARQIMIKDITEVMLEIEPSTAFRIYLGGTNQVVKLTPSPVNRQHAAAWVNAIYGAMQLQAWEDNINDNDNDNSDPEAQHPINMLLDLREQYYILHPEELPVVVYEDQGNYHHHNIAILSLILYEYCICTVCY